MKIILKSKKNNHIVGEIGGSFRDKIIMKVGMQNNKEFILKLQEFLLNHYNLSVISPKEVEANYIIPQLKEQHNTRLRKIGFIKNHYRRLK